MSLPTLENVSSSRRKWFGLLRRKESWSLTGRGWLALLVTLIGGGIIGMRSVHGFLAVNAPVHSGVLVIEGWVHEYALTNFIARARYDMIYTTGGPTLTDRQSRDDSDTYASVAMKRLFKLGVPRAKVRMVPCWVSRRDRTFASAVALHEWGVSNRVEFPAFDVVTLGVHARRSRLLAQKAFPNARVGVVSVLNEDYDPEHWWRYSEGVKETLSEAMAYLYSRFLFSPE